LQQAGTLYTGALELSLNLERQPYPQIQEVEKLKIMATDHVSV